MRQEPIKKQWRILIPSQPMEASACKQAFEEGYHAVVVDHDNPVAPLKPLRKVVAPLLAPFDSAWAPFLSTLPHAVSFFWESALFKADFKEELLKRAMLPAELYVQEIQMIAKHLKGLPLFYVLPHHFPERHVNFLLQRTPASVYFVHSSILGDPDRLDLPSHPFMAKEDPRLIPIYHADPLGFPCGDVPAPAKESFCIAFNRSLEPPSGYPLDTRLCYLQAIATGKENPPLEEMRLLADLLIAEMRYEEKKGIKIDQEPKKRLLIQALEKMRLPVPLALSME